jgi:hypothetical protein
LESVANWKIRENVWREEAHRNTVRHHNVAAWNVSVMSYMANQFVQTTGNLTVEAEWAVSVISYKAKKSVRTTWKAVNDDAVGWMD